MEELGAARRRRPTISSATARPRSRRRGAAISIRSAPARRPTRTPTSTRPTCGTISNGDLIFQPGNATWDGLKYVGGEFGALNSDQRPRGGGLRQDAAAPEARRGHGDARPRAVQELPARRLLPAHAGEGSPGDDRQLDRPVAVAVHARFTLTDPGRDGAREHRRRSADHGVQPERRRDDDDQDDQRRSARDPLQRSRHHRRPGGSRHGWTLLAGYTYSQTKVDLTSLANPNNAFVNAGGVSGGRRHNFKASGSYHAAVQGAAGGQLPLAVGPADHPHVGGADLQRDASRRNCTRQTLTVNAEPRGSVELRDAADAGSPRRPVLRLPPRPHRAQHGHLQPDQRQHGVQHPHRRPVRRRSVSTATRPSRPR